MKKNRALSRCYFGAYIVWLFGGILCPLVLNIHGAAISIVCVVIVVITLAALITSHVFYTKLPKAYAPVSFVGHGLNSLLVVGAFVGELTNTLNGKPATYAWIIASISLVLIVLIDVFLIKGNIKFIKLLKKAPKAPVVEEPKEEEKKEEEPKAE